MTSTTTASKRKIAKLPQKGANTQSQGQRITPQSFSTTKATPSRPQTPIPPDEVEFC